MSEIRNFWCIYVYIYVYISYTWSFYTIFVARRFIESVGACGLSVYMVWSLKKKHTNYVCRVQTDNSKPLHSHVDFLYTQYIHVVFIFRDASISLSAFFQSRDVRWFGKFCENKSNECACLHLSTAEESLKYRFRAYNRHDTPRVDITQPEMDGGLFYYVKQTEIFHLFYNKSIHPSIESILLFHRERHLQWLSRDLHL